VRIKYLYFTPIFFAIHPVLAALVHNREHLYLSQALIPLLSFCLFGISVQGFVLLITRESEFAAIISSVYLIIFSGYGHIARVLRRLCPMLGYDEIFLPITLAVMVFLTWQFWKRKFLIHSTLTILFAIGVALIFIPVSRLAMTGGFNYRRMYSQPSKQLDITSEHPRSRLPDIYYIVPDRYANERILKERFGYDNSSFWSIFARKVSTLCRKPIPTTPGRHIH